MADDDNKVLPPGLVIVGTGVGGVGCAIPVLVIVAILVGRELDRWLGTKPWMLLLLVVASVIIGLLFMVYSVVSAARAAERRYRQRTEDRNS
ncbi:MAG: AtpZ/AtpI family protein [Anaerolineae bacterium]|nr:AtpZ/AtpI family protein [Anaerolineae bacterium]